MSDTVEPNSLARFRTPEAYCAERPEIFASPASLDWFKRRHKARLTEAGAVVRPTGRDLIDPEAFDKVVIAVGLELAGKAAA